MSGMRLAARLVRCWWEVDSDDMGKMVVDSVVLGVENDRVDYQSADFVRMDRQVG
ncbi:hypothetical protein G1C98_0044 [Bifidobacterium sp. DSM 109960]|uniref:Uncharacterized protein n=1 Tax=Bifidobacterium erythrocebi TaxID=2675325 RepID=A0A7Y0ESR4_9BIFI|nr:hypothetical protein [Bifidobacterium sp. DSM 109960]NMM95308.1 hypothetical protein [Bifidobacterium sp. DSM 109960]